MAMLQSIKGQVTKNRFTEMTILKAVIICFVQLFKL